MYKFEGIGLGFLRSRETHKAKLHPLMPVCPSALELEAQRVIHPHMQEPKHQIPSQKELHDKS